jgi:hypothetical protein
LRYLRGTKESGKHDASRRVVGDLHRIADKQVAIEVDGVGASIPETPNFLPASP